MFLIFDISYLIFSFIIYSLASWGAISIGQLIWSQELLFQVLAIVLGYFSFLNLLVILVGVFKIIFQPKLHVGEFPIGLNKKYAGWITNSLFQGIIIASPFAKQIHFIFYLNWIYYRLMGMKLPFSTLVGMETVIRQPELIKVGKKSILGLGCAISCHYSPNGKTHVQKRVTIGDKSVIGGRSSIAPGCTVGNNSVVGALSSVYPDVTIGNNVRIGAECSIKFGSVIPDNAKIKSHTVIDKNCDIKEGETWGGNPARRM